MNINPIGSNSHLPISSTHHTAHDGDSGQGGQYYFLNRSAKKEIKKEDLEAEIMMEVTTPDFNLKPFFLKIWNFIKKICLIIFPVFKTIFVESGKSIKSIHKGSTEVVTQNKGKFGESIGKIKKSINAYIDKMLETI